MKMKNIPAVILRSIVNSPTHNLARAHAQMKLLTDIEAKEEEMYRVLMEIIREGT